MSRLGLIVHGQPPELVGGTERLVAALAAELAAAGETVEVFSGSIEWRERPEVVRDDGGGVPVVRVHRSDLFFERWDKLGSPAVERAYGEWLDAFRPDLVHVHHWARLTDRLVRAAAERGIPAVASLHDLFTSCPRYHRVKADDTFCSDAAAPAVCLHCAPRWRFQGDREIDASVRHFVAQFASELSAAALLLAPTEGHGRRIAGWLGLPVQVVPLPPAGGSVPGPASRPLDERVARPGDPLSVAFFGHLERLKGIDVLLAAARLVQPAGLLRLHVWGAAPDEAGELRLARAAEGLDVRFHGAYRPEDLAGAPVDVAVLPSLAAESYSFALDEAGALGVPIVASDLGALSDRATARVLLLPRGDAAALAGALAALAGDPARRRALRQAPAPPRLGVAEHLARLRALYAQVLAGPRPARQPIDRAALAAREHLAFLRDEGLRELLRSEGWEDVIARLAAENEALRRRPGGAGG